MAHRTLGPRIENLAMKQNHVDAKSLGKGKMLTVRIEYSYVTLYLAVRNRVRRLYDVTCSGKINSKTK